MSNDRKRQGYVEEIFSNLLSNIPESYNKEVNETNFHKLLRAASHELADSQLSIDEVRDNIYLDSAIGDAIYNNFGVFVKLEKRSNWTEEKYKSLIKGVTSALLKGPTKQNLIDAFQLFTQFDIKVFELYKDKDLVDPGVYAGYNPKYTFLLQIEKPVDALIDASTLSQDANYIINIIKPAHTIGIYVVNLRGEEDFREYYGVDKKITELAKIIRKRKIEEKINDILKENLNSLILKYSNDNSVSIEEATNVIFMQNYNMTKQEYEDALVAKTQSLYDEYLKSFQDGPYDLNENDYLIPVLDEEHFSKIAVTELRGVIDKEYLLNLKEEYYLESIGNLTASQLNRIIKSKKDELIAIHVARFGDPNDFTDQEWTDKAIECLKEEAFIKKIISFFQTLNPDGSVLITGEEQLYKDSLEEAKTYKEQYEQNYTAFPYYTGMDQVYVETDNSHLENKYGWKGATHPNQFITSISFSKSKIGGTDLIGPLYSMDDSVHQDFRVAYEEDYRKHRKAFIVNEDEILGENVISGVEFDDLVSMETEYYEEKYEAKDDNALPFDMELSEKYIMGALKRFSWLQTNNELTNINVAKNILMTNDEDFTNKMEESGFEVKEIADFKNKILGFRLNSTKYGLNYATNTMGRYTQDSRVGGVMFRVDANGNEEIIEQRSL